MQDTKDQKAWYIHRIRLINFHNFVDELIDVRNGGHLFLLGDNGSGKTTVIDAIHYVLTAGQSMEFNSAARVVGRKNDGRRPQGIISRYNVGPGHMNPDGAVTYAALELCREGKYVVIAVGMSINSPEDNLTRWGVIKDGSLEEVPFMIHELHGKRPANKFEMRDALKRSGYYGQIGQYCKVLADRFLGGMESFNEFCSFLHMCKAYREIVSNATDYHTLFKKLLPEKRIDLFETIITSLREIETNTGELEELKRKLAHIVDMEEKVSAVTELNGELLCFKYQGTCNNIDLLTRKIEKQRHETNTLKTDHTSWKTKEEQAENEREQCTKLLADLQAQDSEGLIEKEKDLRKQHEELQAGLRELETTFEAQALEVKEYDKKIAGQEEQVKQALGHQLTECSRLSPLLPFSTAMYMQALDMLLHGETFTSLEEIPRKQMRAQTDTALNDNSVEIADLERQLNQAKEAEKELLNILATLKRDDEAVPEVEQFNAARKALHDAMITATPLYKALEWHPDTTPETCSQIEEAIGETVLSTFLIHEKDWDAACAAILPNFPNIRLAKHRDVTAGTTLVDWIRRTFDFQNSDPSAMLVLHHEMSSDTDLEVQADSGFTTLKFRAHKRALQDQPARLIGEMARRKEQQRRIAKKEEDLAECRSNMESHKEQLTALKGARQHLSSFKNLLEEDFEQLQTDMQALAAIYREQGFAKTKLAEQKSALAETKQATTHCSERLASMQQTIEERGLEELESRISACRQRFQAAQEEIGQCTNKIGRIEQQLETLQALLQEESEKLDQQLTRRSEIEEEMKAFFDTDDAMPHFNNISASWRIETGQEFLELYERRKELLTNQQARIEERLQHPDVARYGFVYDRDENQLYDRHQCQISDLTKSMRKNIAEQEEIINDKTNELFRNVIQNSLVRFIIENISRLRNMVKDINTLLSDRQFGQNTYRLQLTPLKEYERFVKTFENFSAFNSTSERDLQELLEDYREEILNSEVNTIPTVLDYRNWFRYEMKVSSTKEEDGEVITRQLRSMGSGGEQAVPNYLLILTIANFLYQRSNIRLHTMLFDEAFYGIDEERRNQLLGFASDLGLQLFVASPDQDGVRKEIAYATSMIVVKDEHFDVHLFANHFENPHLTKQLDLFEKEPVKVSLEFSDEIEIP